MDINFGSIGIDNGMAGAKGVGNDVAAADVASRATARPANLTIGTHVAGIASGEPVADVPDSALAREDKLGMLVGAAFNLPPPPMPDFR